MTDAIERPGGAAPPWQYASAPESTDIVRLDDRYGLFIGGEFVEPKSGRWFPTISPSTEETLAEVAEADSTDVARAVDTARDAAPAWQALVPAASAKYIYRIARLLQDRAREFAVAETMDGGKPIKESRDFDVPMAAAHFFYHAGWADKLEYAFPGRAAAARRRGPGHPVEFSAADARVENRARARRPETRVRPQAGRDDALTALKFGRDSAGGRAAAGRGEHRHRRRRDGRRLMRRHAGVDKIAFTGSTEVGKIIALRSPAPTSGDDGAGWQGREHHLR